MRIQFRRAGLVGRVDVKFGGQSERVDVVGLLGEPSRPGTCRRAGVDIEFLGAAPDSLRVSGA